MTGQELKNRIKETHYSFKDIADGLGCTPQSLTSVFNSNDVRSSTIEKIAVIIGKDMSFFYPASTPTQHQAGDGSQQNSGDNVQQTIGASTELVTKLLEQLDAQRKQIDKLTDNNQRLMDKLLGA